MVAQEFTVIPPKIMIEGEVLRNEAYTIFFPIFRTIQHE